MRDRLDSPTGLQIILCMESISTGLDTTARRWGMHRVCTLISEDRRQPTHILTVLCALRENTATKARKSLSAPRADVDRPPGLSEWTTNVYGECFRFRHAACRAVVRRSALNFIPGDLLLERRAWPHCTVQTMAKHCPYCVERAVTRHGRVSATTDGSPGLPTLTASASLGSQLHTTRSSPRSTRDPIQLHAEEIGNAPCCWPDDTGSKLVRASRGRWLAASRSGRVPKIWIWDLFGWSFSVYAFLAQLVTQQWICTARTQNREKNQFSEAVPNVIDRHDVPRG